MSMLFLIAQARGSIARAKSRGERGQPCLVPLVRGKKSELLPGSLIRVCGL